MNDPRKPVKQHNKGDGCQTPPPSTGNPGTYWFCPVCGQRFMLQNHPKKKWTKY